MNDNRFSALDRMRMSAGAGRLRQNFRALAATDRRGALRLLSDENMQFPTLFILLPVIYAYKLTDSLGPRNFAAANVCAKKLGRYPFAEQAEVWDNEALYQALVWMFTTGWEWDAPEADRDDYEAVIDYVTALLVIIFEDESILPNAASLIYKRHRSGRLIHDLVWCFFQTLDADVLGHVAENLLSPDSRDIALTCKMLDIETAPPAPNRYEAKNLYDDYVAWLKENRPYLYVTGEHLQQTSMPKHFGIDREAKYLGRALSPRYRTPLEPLTEHEITCLHEYRGFSDEEQELLTDYSHRLRSTDAGAWDEWMNKQVAEQVIAAKGGYEAI